MIKENYRHIMSLVGIESNKIVNSWDECKSLVMGYKGAKFKKFNSKQDAEKYLVESQNISEEIDVSLKRDCRKLRYRYFGY